MRRYVIVSPVKDEDRYVERTLRSVSNQTIRPVRWIIVDDGSTDRTPEILRRYADEHDWIRVVTRESHAPRQPGSAVMHAFYRGLTHTNDIDYDYLVKLDCDLELPQHYFEFLFTRFEREPRLGIASGVYLEEGPQGWSPVRMPTYHAAGASKVMRSECFEGIGGFVHDRGWDTVDEIRAHMRGWTTRHFQDLHFKHLKLEGSGIGSLQTSLMHGEVYYLTGGGALFFLLKVLHRMAAGSPPVLGGLGMLYGYLRCWASGRQKLVTPLEARHYRRLLNSRIYRRRPKPGADQTSLESS